MILINEKKFKKWKYYIDIIEKNDIYSEYREEILQIKTEMEEYL